MLLNIISPEILTVFVTGIAFAGFMSALIIEYVIDSKTKPALSRLSLNISVFTFPFLIIVFYLVILNAIKIVTR